MKRSAPLRRKTPLRAVSKKNSYRRRKRNFAHMSTVRRWPCIVRTWQRLFGALSSLEISLHFGCELPNTVTTCSGRVQADHMGDRPKGWKAADETCVGICKKHHDERTDYRGMFKNFDAVMMRTWCNWAIAVTQEELAHG